jgi:4-phytase / acid phosphatase
VVVLIRHGVRAPIESEIRGSLYNRQPWAAWPVQPGVLTEHGASSLKLLGNFYRERYGALFGGGTCEEASLYVEANSSQRTIATGKALLASLRPECGSLLHTRPPKQANPLFTPARKDLIDWQKLADAINGRLANRPDWFTHAFSRPLERMEQILNTCGQPDCAAAKPDFRTTQALISAEPGKGIEVQSPVSMGADFAEHFLLEYTEGMPMSKVGWGLVNRADLDQLMEMNTRFHDFILRTPYFAQVAGSNLAGRILATLQAASSDAPTPGALGKHGDRAFFLVGHDSNLAWLGGLLRLDWLLPDETFNATPPGSALVFELHRRTAEKQDYVQAYFVAQTLDQIRNLTTPSHDATTSPAMVPIFIPGCSEHDSANPFACSLNDFKGVVQKAIDSRFVETN